MSPRIFATPHVKTHGIHRASLRRSALLATAIALCTTTPTWAGYDPFIGELMLVPYSFCPQGWAEADGRLLAISSNSALFSLLGTQYGGNGTTDFALPDLRGRVPLGVGTGPGLTTVTTGQTGGTESVTLTTSSLPQHSHALGASTAAATHAAPADTRVLAQTQNAGSYVSGPATQALGATSIGATGGGQPFAVRNPYLGMRWCIALSGIYPSSP